MSRKSQLRMNVRTAREEFTLSMKALREADNAFILASDAVRAVQDAVDAVNRAEAALREADPPVYPTTGNRDVLRFRYRNVCSKCEAKARRYGLRL